MNQSLTRLAARINLPVLLLQIFLLLAVVFPQTGSAFRENDGASYIGGAWQLIHGQASPFHNILYNFDKQYGAYGLLALAMRLFPGTDPLLAANLLQVIFVAIAMLACAALPRRPGARLASLAAILLCPVWLLSAPFFSPASLSGAVLIMAIVVMPASYIAGSALALFAVTLRADAVLLIPLLVWAHSPRMSLPKLILRPRVLATGILTLALVALGRLTSAGLVNDTAGLFLNPKYLIVCLVFGFGASAAVYAGGLAGLLRVSLSKRKWTLWYLAGFAAAALPPAYYGLQIHSPRYFFLSSLAGLCLVTSRRYGLTIPKSAGSRRLAAACILLAATVPWVAGLDMPSVKHVRPTLLHPTLYPTADGHMPLGAYLGFVHQVAGMDRFQIDHNQQIWLAAFPLHYAVCGNAVPLLGTPMEAFLELAVRLGGRQPVVDDMTGKFTCPFAYADLRSLSHGLLDAPEGSDFGDAFLRRHAIERVSPDDSEETIVRVDYAAPASALSALVLAVRHRFGGSEIEFRWQKGDYRTVERIPWAKYVFFNEGGRCDFDGVRPVEESEGGFTYWTLDSDPSRPAAPFRFRCGASPIAGYARDAMPPYMTRGQ